MAYENAPATHILATECAYCRRPLLDAASVEAGVGPVCRKKYSVPNGVMEAIRTEVNHLVWECSVTDDVNKLAANIQRIFDLGCDVIAERLLKRCGSSRIELADGYLWLETKFPSATQLQAIRDVPGRRWVGERKMNRFPIASADELSMMLAKHFPGLMRVETMHEARWLKAGTSLLQSGIAGIEVQKAVATAKDELPASATTDEKGRVWLRPNLDFDVRVWYEDEKHPCEYVGFFDQRVDLAQDLTRLLTALGFEQQTDRRLLPRGCDEQVWERVVVVREDKPEVRVTVRVYTSIVGEAVRDRGDDAIKVNAVKHNWTKDRYTGQWQLRAFGLSKDKRIHRVGNIPKILNRVLDRIERAYRLAAEEKGCPGCAGADHGHYCPLHMGGGAPRKAPSKKQVERDQLARQKAEERKQERYEARMEARELASRGELPGQWENR